MEARSNRERIEERSEKTTVSGSRYRTEVQSFRLSSSSRKNPLSAVQVSTTLCLNSQASFFGIEMSSTVATWSNSGKLRVRPSATGSASNKQKRASGGNFFTERAKTRAFGT